MKLLYYMLKGLLSFIFFCSFLVSNSQGNVRFQFEIIESTDSTAKQYGINQMTSTTPLYEDEKYSVTRSCSGEWGGTLKFRNKSTGAEFVCSATCPVAVNYLAGKYIVTNSLVHLAGSSEILEIEDPEKLSPYEAVPPRREGSRLVRVAGDDESKSTIGTKVVLSTYRIITLASFQVKGTLYHIVTTNKATFVATVRNSQFQFIQQLLDYPISGYDPIMLRKSDTEAYTYWETQSPGYLRITGNKITFYKPHPKSGNEQTK